MLNLNNVNMKKLRIFLSIGLMFIALFCVITSCNKDDVPNSISLKMRNSSNGGKSINWTNSSSSLYINESNNFVAYCWSNGESSIASVGKVKGLGRITEVPGGGWASQVAVSVGYGYVVRWKSNDASEYSYARVYVEDKIVGTSGGILGYQISYVEGF